ncbi:MAG: TSUP family transporter [Burkholderiales bacterium]
MELLLLSVASMLGGFIDAVVGGGGLIMVPALFATFPGAMPATLMGTNKSASILGTTLATWQFSRRVAMNWPVLLPAAAVGFVFSFAGAGLLTVVPADRLRDVLPVLLVVLLIYTLAKKELGRSHAPRLHGRAEKYAACSIGALVGFYDGFFGPGTGSFFVFLFVRVLGYDFLHASASAKLLNVATNGAALLLFGFTGHVWWHFALMLAAANIVGSLLGTYMAMRHGSGFVRVVFIGVVSALIVKTSWDAWWR